MINICDDITAPTTFQPDYSCVLLLPPDSKSRRRVYFPAWLIGPVAGRSKSVNARAPVSPAPSSWLRDQSSSAQPSPDQARRAKISLLGLLKLLWLTGWRCQSFTEHSTKAEASRFISRFKMTWSILRQHKEKPLPRSPPQPKSLFLTLHTFRRLLLLILLCPLSMSPWSTSSVIKSFMLFLAAATLGWLAWDSGDLKTCTEISHFHCNAICQNAARQLLHRRLSVNGHQMWHSSHTPHSTCTDAHIHTRGSLNTLPVLLVGNFIYFLLFRNL